MKTILLLLFNAALFFFMSSPLQGQHRCGHRHGFGRSPVADTISAHHYKIHLTAIDFSEKTIQAVTRISLTPLVELSQIPLELKDLLVDSVFVDQIKHELYYQEDDLLRIPTENTYTPDDTISLVVYYGGNPFHEGWGGFHFSGNYAFNLGVGFESDPHNLGKAWFPCVDDFQDRATYEVLITLPDTLSGIAGGVLTEIADHGNGYLTWHWSLNQTIPTYLASVAAGEYALTADLYEGLDADIPITVYTRPADTHKVAGSFQHLHQVMEIFEDKFTPYPWERIGYTGTAIGAMEHVTNIAYPHFAINGNLNYEELLVHELSHMWFGNKVTCATEGDMWLNEGWATFCQLYYQNQLYGPQTYREAMNAMHYGVLRDAHITDNAYLPLSGVPTEYVYGKTVYEKGATVVHTLMNYLGEEVFFDAVKAYLQHFAYSHASSGDMRDFLSDYTGIDMAPFFDAWVFTPGSPHYSIDSLMISSLGNAYEVAVYLRQKRKGYDFTGDQVILEISFLDENWQIHTDTVHFSGQTGLSVKQLDFEPVLVMADYFDKTCDATTDVDFILHEAGEYTFSDLYLKLFVDALPDSAFVRLTHHWAPADEMQSAVNGLRLSPYRYWQVDGIIADETEMRGRFFYSNNTLENTLILSPSDSVVMLYRPDKSVDWHHVDQYRHGVWNIGFIFIDDLKPGEYTFAVWDTQVSLPESQSTKHPVFMRAYPNPAAEAIKLSWDNNLSGVLQVYNSQGSAVMEQNLQQAQSILIDTSRWAKGVYMAELKDRLTGRLLSTKFILQ